jgi:hypothetical protein
MQDACFRRVPQAARQHKRAIPFSRVAYPPFIQDINISKKDTYDLRQAWFPHKTTLRVLAGGVFPFESLRVVRLDVMEVTVHAVMIAIRLRP